MPAVALEVRVSLGVRGRGCACFVKMMEMCLDKGRRMGTDSFSECMWGQRRTRFRKRYGIIENKKHGKRDYFYNNLLLPIL